MKSSILIFGVLFLFCIGCSGDPGPEDPIDQGNPQGQEDDLEENIEDENLDEENLDQEGENINSDIDNEFVDNQILDNNENILTQNNAVDFGDGQNNQFFQNEGEGQFQNQDNLFANDDLEGQQQLMGQQQLQGNQQLFNQGNQQLFNQGDQQMLQDQQLQDSGEGINNAMDNDEFLQDQQTDFQQAAVDNSVNEIVDQAAMSGGRVKYVTAGGSNLYDQPDGSTVAPLEKGDHPLVFDEGEWARTSDGYYVPNRDLTTSPVSRIRRKKAWIY